MSAPMNDLPPLLTLDITSLSHDGRGIARSDAAGSIKDPCRPALGGRQDSPEGRNGPVIFVNGALPGQEVRACITRRKSRFMEAEAVALLRPAAGAAPPLCPHYAECGGCPLQTMGYKDQLYWKRALALDALQRIGGLSRTVLDALLPAAEPSPALTRYRNKMEFAFGNSADGGLILGLRRRGRHEILNVPGCALMPPEAQAMVEFIRNLAQKSGLKAHEPPSERTGHPPQTGRDVGNTRRRRENFAMRPSARTPDGFWRFLVLRRGLAADLRTPRWWAVCITSPGAASGRDAVHRIGRAVLTAFPQLTAFIHEERMSEDALAIGEKRIQILDAQGLENPLAARLHLPLAKRFFTLDASSFFQVNTGAAQTLARIAADLLTPPDKNREDVSLLDLYCGAGAPGLTLAAGYTALLGLEQDTRAISLARANAAAQGHPHCHYKAGDAATLLEQLQKPGGPWSAGPSKESSLTGEPPTQHIDCLADPPRAGLSPRTLEALLAVAPRRILYISCNPSTLARDAARLRQHYSLEKLSAVDLFPHTPHLECLSLWRRLR